MYYRYRLNIREEFSPIHHGGRLFQQYCVDAYTKVESNRLRWFNSNQTQIRRDSYTGLMDYVAKK